MKKFVIPILIVVVVVVGGFLVFSGGDDGGSEGAAQVACEARAHSGAVFRDGVDALRPFAFRDYNGDCVSSADFAGKSLVVNSWAVWCPFCKDELPDFAEVQREFADDVVFIAIDRRESLEKAKGFTDQYGITDSMIFLLDPKDDFYKSIGGFSMPETLFVDVERNIQLHKRGVMKLDEARERTQQLLSSN